ncbi:hypothetical protein SAMN05428981_1011283 [Bacillus sp. OV194]|nr:hypothetical protein SAMN05428981_1011283 [Bacillus sp. OV194]
MDMADEVSYKKFHRERKSGSSLSGEEQFQVGGVS